MKCFVIFFALAFISTLWAREGDILKCLGAEEKKFHLNKNSGPLYDLNQKLISEMIQIPHIQLGNGVYREICQNDEFSPSWKLLELSISKGKAIFQIPERLTGSQKMIEASMIEDYIDSTREILLAFISQIQALSPTPTCLKEKIPELNLFFERVKYLQTDMELKAIFQGRDQKIFKKLSLYPKAFKECQARLKKKDKSLSTAPLKNR